MLSKLVIILFSQDIIMTNDRKCVCFLFSYTDDPSHSSIKISPFGARKGKKILFNIDTNSWKLPSLVTSTSDCSCEFNIVRNFKLSIMS